MCYFLLLSGSRMAIPLLTARLSLDAVNYANWSCFLYSTRSTDGCAATVADHFYAAPGFAPLCCAPCSTYAFISHDSMRRFDVIAQLTTCAQIPRLNVSLVQSTRAFIWLTSFVSSSRFYVIGACCSVVLADKISIKVILFFSTLYFVVPLTVLSASRLFFGLLWIVCLLAAFLLGLSFRSYWCNHV
jgi:hypothetical protein